MTTIFIGGSRHVSRLPVAIKERLNTVIEKGHRVVVGDANGADKAVQRHFADAHYEDVTVFCSGERPRNNVGDWQVHHIEPAAGVKGFQFYAAKDRAMACEADFGLMIWDGKSAGTVLNTLRLAQAGKIAVLANVPDKSSINIKTADQWRSFFDSMEPALRDDLRSRATPEEWSFVLPAAQLGLSLNTVSNQEKGMAAQEDQAPAVGDPVAAINAALIDGDIATFVDALGEAARAHGMSQVARDTGLSRESLYRSLGNGGNPEFGTIIRVARSLGLQLQLKPN